MELVIARRGGLERMEYLDDRRVLLNYRMPLSEMIVGFYDRLKASSRGYASLDYEFGEYETADVVKLDVLVNRQPVDALSVIVHSDQAHDKGQTLVSRLKKVIPRQLFDVAIQAAVGSRVISRANVKALRKDVLAKCYGGDVTRKKKLLERQKEGKKRLKRLGNVEIPQEAFMSVLKLSD
jgi:GTP-binding protein LepA